VFTAWETIASDPNWTITVLDRALRREEERRGKPLPDVLYLQVDNCIRENKNSYLLSYLVWLVERGIFKEVMLSYLPVGHTHFDCDQFASRLSELMKFLNVVTVPHLLEVIKSCYSPQPEVEFVTQAADWKELFNPGLGSHFPVETSRIRQSRGCATKIVLPMYANFMAEGSPLHFRIRPGADKKVMVQTKHTCLDDVWSVQHYTWTNAPRPDNRDFEPVTHTYTTHSVTHTHTHTYTPTVSHTPRVTHTHTHTHTLTHTHIPRHTYTYSVKHMHTHTHTHTAPRTHTHIHT
jgi:hypothetical protein